MTRLKKEDCERYRRQNIEEVWFVGCHSDIGGGDKEEVTARIALRWMLGEAVNVEQGVRLNDEGEKLDTSIYQFSERRDREIESRGVDVELGGVGAAASVGEGRRAVR